MSCVIVPVRWSVLPPSLRSFTGEEVGTFPRGEEMPGLEGPVAVAKQDAHRIGALV